MGFRRNACCLCENCVSARFVSGGTKEADHQLFSFSRGKRSAIHFLEQKRPRYSAFARLHIGPKVSIGWYSLSQRRKLLALGCKVVLRGVHQVFVRRNFRAEITSPTSLDSSTCPYSAMAAFAGLGNSAKCQCRSAYIRASCGGRRLYLIGYICLAMVCIAELVRRSPVKRFMTQKPP